MDIYNTFIMSGEEGQPSSYHRRNTEHTTTKTSRPSYVRRSTDPGRQRPNNGVESSNIISKNRNTTSNTKKKKSKNTIKQQQPNRQESRLLGRQRSKMKSHDKITTAQHNRLQKHNHINDNKNKSGRQHTQKFKL